MTAPAGRIKGAALLSLSLPLLLLIPLWLLQDNPVPSFQVFRLFSGSLVLLSLGCFGWGLWNVRRGDPSREAKPGSGKSSYFFSWPAALVLFVAALVLFSLVRAQLISSRADDPRREYLLAGDEPSYLLMAHSLVFDRDLDVDNNREDTRFFYRKPLTGPGQFGFAYYNQASRGRLTGREKEWGESQYFFFRPGLPLLIAPAYWVGFQAQHRIRWAVLVWMNLLAAAFIVCLYGLARSLSQSSYPPLVAPLFFAASAPVIYYSSQIYPDLPAALVLAGALLGLIRAGGKGGVLLTGLLAASLPWLNERFLLHFLILLGAGFFRRPFRVHWVCFLVFPLASLVLQGFYYSAFYGVPWPLSSRTPLVLAALPRGLAAVLADRDRGLMFLNPLLLLALWGLVPLWRRDRWLGITLAALILATLIPVAAFPEWHGGVCPPLRYLLPLIPLLVLPLTVSLEEPSRPFVRLGLLILGAWGIWWGVKMGWQPKVWFWRYGPQFQDQAYQMSHAFFPGYLIPRSGSQWLSAVWLLLLAGFPLLDRVFKTYRSAPDLGKALRWTPIYLTAGILGISWFSSWINI